MAAAQLGAEVSSITRKEELYTRQAHQQHPLQRQVLELFHNNPQQLRADIAQMRGRGS